uniref:Uncharacterized protein n=1 Tax=Setaria viridis TaxID=4556 RepID=A0A4V6D3B8_SETVI|nr:hypothetical protein SEVIR_8G220314v2 [Setaria viridis]
MLLLLQSYHGLLLILDMFDELQLMMSISYNCLMLFYVDNNQHLASVTL